MPKHLLLVGGNSGIGPATARAALAAGHAVTVMARNPAPLAAPGIPVLPFEAAAPEIASLLPESLDGVVYFPGTISLKAFHRLTTEDFLRDFQVNCLGAVAALQAALPALKKSGDASVVLFSTVAVAQGMAFHASMQRPRARWKSSSAHWPPSSRRRSASTGSLRRSPTPRWPRRC